MKLNILHAIFFDKYENWTNFLQANRRTLSDWDKARVQKRLQAAYTNNAEGFYVNAPKKHQVHLKKLFEYIGRYIERGPIALDRIIMYDGETVMFHYQDKRTQTKETKTMPVNEFIGALIRHIPDHQFKTIRRYGIYSRRTKSLMKKVLEAYQAIVHRMLVNVKETLKPKSWEERITEEFGTNPMKCTECGEYYEFYGVSAAKNGRLVVKYAKNEDARRFMREENQKYGKKRSKLSTKKQRKQLLKRFASIGNGNVSFICLDCGVKENIPSDVVGFLDGMDVDFDPTNAPQFNCKECGGEMYPEYYKNKLGYEFRINDRQ